MNPSVAVAVPAGVAPEANVQTVHQAASASEPLGFIEKIESKIPPEIKSLGATASKLSGVFSSGKGAFDAAVWLGTALGIFEAEPSLADQVNKIIAAMGAYAHASDWASAQRLVGDAIAPADWARTEVKDYAADLRGGWRFPRMSDVNTNSGLALTRLMNDGLWQRVYTPEAIKGDWQRGIPGPYPSSSTTVYEWRLAMPALLKALSYRLTVMAAIDPNFARDQSFRSHLVEYRDFLRRQLEAMKAGIRCGYQTQEVYFYDFIAKRDEWLPRVAKTTIACADVNSGQSAIRTLDIDSCGTWEYRISDGKYHCKLKQTPDELDTIQEHLRRSVERSMPLFEAQSMLDTLNLYVSGQEDLTAGDRHIHARFAPNLCVMWSGTRFFGDPALAACQEIPNQRWTYDRSEGQLRNELGYCLDVQWGVALHGTPVWMWDCTGDPAQRWTWDPETGVLQNALGTVLDVQWGSLQAGAALWTWHRWNNGAQSFQ